MAHIAVLGLGNWGSAIARLWLLEGHKVKGWTIEQEVYESITMEGMNHKYLPDHSLDGLEATMHVEEALEGSEIIVLAVPSSVILNVVEDIIDHLEKINQLDTINRHQQLSHLLMMESHLRKDLCT